MKPSLAVVPLAVASLLAAPLSAQEKEKLVPASIVLASQIAWAPPPPGLPAGARFALLHGELDKKGAFTVRLKMPDGYRIPPHWHTKSEQLTVLSGTLLLSMGSKLEPAAATTLPAGSFHFLPGGVRHAAVAKGETVLEIHGHAPFDIHYLDASDDPGRVAAAGDGAAGSGGLAH